MIVVFTDASADTLRKGEQHQSGGHSKCGLGGQALLRCALGFPSMYVFEEAWSSLTGSQTLGDKSRVPIRAPMPVPIRGAARCCASRTWVLWTNVRSLCAQHHVDRVEHASCEALSATAAFFPHLHQRSRLLVSTLIPSSRVSGPRPYIIFLTWI